MKNANGRQLSTPALVLIVGLTLLIPLLSVIGYQLGRMEVRLENFSCQADLLECEVRTTEVMTQCLRAGVQRQHGEIE